MTLIVWSTIHRSRVSSKNGLGLRECVIYNDPKMAAGEGSTSTLELELKFGGTTHASDVCIRTQDTHFVYVALVS